VDSFRICSSGVRDETQIHTHMCYSEFNDIIDAIGAMDADVISIETSRSKMETARPFKGYRYPNEIGPGVYDIHPRAFPNRRETDLLKLARQRLSDAHSGSIRLRAEDPQNGRKSGALANMVAAARELRPCLKHRMSLSHNPAIAHEENCHALLDQMHEHETGATLSRQYLAGRRHVARAGLIAIPVSGASYDADPESRDPGAPLPDAPDDQVSSRLQLAQTAPGLPLKRMNCICLDRHVIGRRGVALDARSSIAVPDP